MKKQIIALGILLLVILGGIAIVNYLGSFHKVTLTLNQRVSEITLYKRAQTDQQITTLKQTGEVSLQAGSYYVVPKGETISDNKIGFDVGNSDMTFNVNPDFSESYMAQKLVEEEPLISTALQQAFPLTADYLLQGGKLFNEGDWYAAVIRQKADMRAESDWYRIVAHKENGQWKIIYRPTFVITKNNFGSVPDNVMSGANAIIASPTL